MLTNPSFEDTPKDATVPTGWQACEPGTTPDILPGFWSVYTPPFDGNSYMGLITREDGSWESVGQRLTAPLKSNECYAISMKLAHANTYAGYNIPVRFRIWGGKSPCQKLQLLGETQSVQHVDWKRYDFKFTTKQEVFYIILEAYYAPGVFFHYNGNVLIDGISSIIRCNRA